MLKKINELMVRCYIKKDSGWHRIKNVLREERGAGAVEYALVIAVVVIMVIAAATFMKGPLVNFFNAVVDQVKTFMTSKKTP
ncbi:MAG TPA: Flp family type IVb pilin [Desulfobacteraceae bacterium]|nr:Flp family type IVb pilin [Desulfobacteraceae bacterium]HPJ68712.1 Flp family type IVb pilin [Desulfobacteraceae bacterium]HPQ28998.1 Flp family type IVb pilin [Desulfobacteraceae bacterium]